MKTKRRWLLLRAALVCLAMYAVINILQLRASIGAADDEIATLTQEINMKKLENAAIEKKIDDRSSDDAVRGAARSELSMIEPGEQILIDVSN